MYAQEEYPCNLKSKRFPPQPHPTKKGKERKKEKGSCGQFALSGCALDNHSRACLSEIELICR